LGTLSTAAIVHIYRGAMEDVKLSSLLLTIFIAEQLYLATQYLIRTALQKIGSETQRREEARQYVVRKRYLETFNEEAAELSVKHRSRAIATTAPSTDERIGNGMIRADSNESVTDPYEVRRTLLRTNSETLHPERTVRFWSWQRSAKETIDAGVKLIKALAVVRISGDVNRAAKRSHTKEKA
jgi:anoctamin-10